MTRYRGTHRSGTPPTGTLTVWGTRRGYLGNPSVSGWATEKNEAIYNDVGANSVPWLPDSPLTALPRWRILGSTRAIAQTCARLKRRTVGCLSESPLKGARKRWGMEPRPEGRG